MPKLLHHLQGKGDEGLRGVCLLCVFRVAVSLVLLVLLLLPLPSAQMYVLLRSPLRVDCCVLMFRPSPALFPRCFHCCPAASAAGVPPESWLPPPRG